MSYRRDFAWRNFLVRFLVIGGTLVLMLAATPPVRTLISLPHHVRLIRGEVQEISEHLPVRMHIKADRGGMLKINGSPLSGDGWREVSPGFFRIEPMYNGRYHLELRAFGLIPIRHVTLEVMEPMKVIPGGQSIGVIVNSGGVVVVDKTSINVSGVRRSPADAAGIKVGDMIVAIDGKPVKDKDVIAQKVSEAGRQGGRMILTIRREGREMKTVISPLFDGERQRYLVGLWIKDSATGIGTLTFIEPHSARYAALGHMVTDGDGKAVDVDFGKVISAYISGIEPGRPGAPGEKIGVLLGKEGRMGTIENNTFLGIFGTLDRPPQATPLPVALETDVAVGPAKMYTVVQGQEPEGFDVVIERVFPQGRPTEKGMVVRVTDPSLLSLSGGIVQGMSGSPIIQEGKLVGAVTHVFVNDPTRGYAVFAEWMVREMSTFGSGGDVALLPSGLAAALAR